MSVYHEDDESAYDYSFNNNPEKEQQKLDEALMELLKAVDTAVWCWSVQKNSKRKGQVDWKSSLDELIEAYELFQLKTSEEAGER